jgi:hypothetical protein
MEGEAKPFAESCVRLSERRPRLQAGGHQGESSEGPSQSQSQISKERKTVKKLSHVTKPRNVPVAHACNPSYSGGRDQEEQSSKPARENSSLSTKNGLVGWLKVKALNSNPVPNRKRK